MAYNIINRGTLPHYYCFTGSLSNFATVQRAGADRGWNDYSFHSVTATEEKVEELVGAIRAYQQAVFPPEIKSFLSHVFVPFNLHACPLRSIFLNTTLSVAAIKNSFGLWSIVTMIIDIVTIPFRTIAALPKYFYEDYLLEQLKDKLLALEPYNFSWWGDNPAEHRWRDLSAAEVRKILCSLHAIVFPQTAPNQRLNVGQITGFENWPPNDEDPIEFTFNPPPSENPTEYKRLLFYNLRYV